MILIIKKIKIKIAYQMWVAASLKVKYIWNLNSLEFTWGVRTHTQQLNKCHTHRTIKQEPNTHTTKTHTKQLNKSHTHTNKTEGTRREVQSWSKLKKKKKNMKKKKKKKKKKELEVAG